MEFIKSSGINAYIFLIAILVIVLFGAAFIILAAFFFNAKKKNIENGLDDKEITSDVERYITKRLKRNKACDLRSIDKDLKSTKKQNRTINRTTNIILAALFAMFTVLIVFALTSKAQGDQLWFGNTAMLVIQTDSMETAYKNNEYLKDENGNFNEKDRIKQYSFITISKEQKYIDNIAPYDVVAFKFLQDQGDSYVTVVHRLIKIEYDENGEALYTFRGDANTQSYASETRIKKDLIIGVYQTEGYKGAKNVAFGFFVTYLQSNIGIIVVVVAFVVMGIYSVLNDRLSIPYDERFEYLISQEGEAIAFNKSKELHMKENHKKKGDH